MRWNLIKRNQDLRPETKNDPFFGYMDRLHRELNETFDSLFGNFSNSLAESGFTPSVDIDETDKSIVINAELAGLEEKDISVSISNSIMTIKGEKKCEDEKKSKKSHCREISYGYFERSFSLPEGIDAENIKARFKNGVLKVEIPKLEVAEPKKIAVKVE